MKSLSYDKPAGQKEMIISLDGEKFVTLKTYEQQAAFFSRVNAMKAAWDAECESILSDMKVVAQNDTVSV